MAIRKNKVDARENLQESRGVAAADNSRYDGVADIAQDWLDVQASFSEPEAEVFLPRVIGRLPDMRQSADAPAPRKRRGFRFVGTAAMLAVAFGLGALSVSLPSRNVDGDDLAVSGEQAAEDEPQSSDLIAYSATDNWPKLPNIEPEPESAYAGYGGSPVAPRYDDAAETLYDAGVNARRNDSVVLGADARSDSFDGFSAPYQSPVAEEYANPAQDLYPDSNAFAADNDASDVNAAAEPAGGFSGGFADYQFGAAAQPTPYAQTAQPRAEAAQDFNEISESHAVGARQTAVVDNGRFLSANQFDGNDFNDSADFDGFNNDANQKNFAANTRRVAADEKDGYNNREEYQEDVYAWSKDTSASESRFQGFGSSWDGGESRFDEVSSESPFPVDSDFNAEYVANNYEKESAETTNEAPRAPARSVRW